MSPQQKFPPPGQMIDIGGFRLHASVSGQGTPAVILEPGLGGFSFQYTHIQPAVAAFTRVMAYDRAGQGWSDSSPRPRTPANLASEMKTLLSRLDLRPPYVLVGHSFGGLLVRLYAGFHPDEVAGVVLVDSSDVEQYDTFPNLDKLTNQMAMGVRVLKIASRAGLGKHLAKLSLGKAAGSLSKEDLDTFLTVVSQPKHLETQVAEFAQHRCYFGPDSQVPQSLGETPLIVITAGNSVSGKQKFGGITADQVNERHQQWQKDLSRISSRGEHRVVPGATHFSILFQPEHAAVVVDAIRRLVERIRIE